MFVSVRERDYNIVSFYHFLGSEQDQCLVVLKRAITANIAYGAVLSFLFACQFALKLVVKEGMEANGSIIARIYRMIVDPFVVKNHFLREITAFPLKIYRIRCVNQCIF